MVVVEVVAILVALQLKQVGQVVVVHIHVKEQQEVLQYLMLVEHHPYKLHQQVVDKQKLLEDQVVVEVQVLLLE